MTARKTTPHFKRGPKTTPVLDRFWSQVEIGKNDDCWLFKGEPKAKYPRFTLGRKTRLGAHQFSWIIANAVPIPDGLQVDHLCYTTRCVNPTHLEVKTGWENRLRCRNNPVVANAFKTHCPKNHHEYDVINSDGSRGCSTCKRDWTRAYRARYNYGDKSPYDPEKDYVTVS